MSQEITSLLFRPKKASAIWLLLGCIVFVAGSIWMAQQEGWIGYLCAGFFAIGIPIAGVQLLPGSTYLRVTEEGLTFASMYRVTAIPWDSIDHFFVVSLRQTGITVHKMVGFNFVPSYHHARAVRSISAAVAACEGALPSLYGKKAEELADLLNRCLEKFTQREDGHAEEPEPE